VDSERKRIVLSRISSVQGLIPLPGGPFFGDSLIDFEFVNRFLTELDKYEIVGAVTMETI
jgi:hypothetical protein